MITFANHNIHHTCASLAVPQKKTKARTTMFFHERASLGTPGTMQEVWNDQRDISPSEMES